MRTFIALHHCILLCVLVTGCQTMVSAAGHPTSDTSNWQTHRVQVNNQVVEFSIPPGESSEFPAFEIPQKLDLSDPDAFSKTMTGPSILNRYWDYRAGGLSPVEDTLHAYIGVFQSSVELTEDQSIKGAIEENSRLYATHVAKDRKGLLDPPLRYEAIVVGGRKWLQVDYRISGRCYVTEFDNYHYLKVDVSGGGFRAREMGADADATARAILQSIRVEPAG